MPPKTPMCIRDEKEDALREVQVPEQRQHGFIERVCFKKGTTANGDTSAQALMWMMCL